MSQEAVMKKIIRYNLEIFTAILLIFCISAVIFRKDLPLISRLAAGYMFLYMLHEWEEGRIPGGFYDLFFGRVGVEVKGDTNAMHIPAAIMIIVFTALPFFFPGARILIVPPICLSLFEGFIHTLGIKLMQTKKPYTPGMVTAWLMFIFAVYSIIVLPPLPAGTWILGILLLLIEFFTMQASFIHLAGYSYKELIPLFRKNVLGR